jgi:NIMA-interacting peptidyl-prolyl cis-trans isomerase 1
MDSEVRCKHILLKHLQSRNPTDSYRNKKVTRTKEQAIAGIQRKNNSLRFKFSILEIRA